MNSTSPYKTTITERGFYMVIKKKNLKIKIDVLIALPFRFQTSCSLQQTMSRADFNNKRGVENNIKYTIDITSKLKLKTNHAVL